MEHPLVIIGAGPTGLAAATQAWKRGMAAVVLEAGDEAGDAVSQWGHVRLFSPWSEVVDPTARDLLLISGWNEPSPSAYPTGADWVAHYLAPLARALDATDLVDVRTRHRVTGVARLGRDLVVDSGRDIQPFVLHLQTPKGPARLLASAVIDASGTWATPNPLGGDGLPALGEHAHAHAHAEHITYRIPDLRDPSVAQRYAGRHVVIAGTGASAANTLVEMTRIAAERPGTRVSWLVRRANVSAETFGGGDNDELVARGALGSAAQVAVESPAVTTFTSFRTASITRTGDTLSVESVDGQRIDDVDEIVALTGLRPDLGFLGEVRLDLDSILQAPRALAPLIDPNEHSCGTVYPHGAAELAQPEHGLFLAGMKSYGRAPSFLAMTGFEQVRSIVAKIDGDDEAAARVELTLPETGVCGGAGVFEEDRATSTAGVCC